MTTTIVAAVASGGFEAASPVSGTCASGSSGRGGFASMLAALSPEENVLHIWQYSSRIVQHRAVEQVSEGDVLMAGAEDCDCVGGVIADGEA